MNPIWKREFLARWRDERSYLLLLSLVVLLSVSAYWVYQTALASTFSNSYTYTRFGYVPVVESLATRASRTGHSLFQVLAIGNVLMWFLLAPLLTATGVARERERGLLESLQLSRMTSMSQIAARTLSALSYLAILQVITMPVYFVAFSFGGVDELQIFRVWLVVAAVAFCGVGLGLAFSAQSARPASALFAVIVLLVVWTALSFIGGSRSFLLWYIGINFWTVRASEWLLYSHPLTLVWIICNPTDSFIFGMTPAGAALPIDRALSLATKIWLVIGVVGLVKATRDVTRAFPPSGWAERNILIQKWKKSREERLRIQRERASRKAQVSVEGALLADLPFDRIIRFKNPLLNREVKGRFRIRRGSVWVWMGRTVIAVGAAGAWMMVLFTVFFDTPSRASSFPIVLWAEWLLGTALIATFSASSFAREREAGTWEGIQLSLFSAREIMRSKWAAPVIAFGLMSSPLWIFLIALLPIFGGNGIEGSWILLSALVVLSSLCWTSALGNWISLRAKTAAGAICWTIGILLVLFLGILILEESLDIPRHIASWVYGGSSVYDNSSYNTGYGYYRYPNYDLIQRVRIMAEAWNPLAVISSLQDKGRGTRGLSYASGNDELIMNMAVLHIVLATLGTWGLLVSIKKQLRSRGE